VQLEGASAKASGVISRDGFKGARNLAGASREIQQPF
jgi:hypothetical protein